MTDRWRIVVAGAQIAAMAVIVASTIKERAYLMEIRELTAKANHCKPFYNGMTLGPGECAYMIIPGPPAGAATGEQL